MHIKLKYLGLVIVSIFINCKSRMDTKNHFSEDEEYYILAFKKEVIYSCINEKTNREFYSLLNKYDDLGLYTEVEILYHETTLKAAFVGKEYSKKIKPVNYPDAENKLPIFRDCINYAFSKEVDSIARDAYKKSR